MQELPPIPDDSPAPSTPGEPTPAPAEEPPMTPDIDVPAPDAPGTETPTTPISPVG